MVASHPTPSPASLQLPACVLTRPALPSTTQGSDGIVPVYHFGNTQLLDIFPQSIERISRRMRAGGLGEGGGGVAMVCASMRAGGLGGCIKGASV